MIMLKGSVDREMLTSQCLSAKPGSGTVPEICLGMGGQMTTFKG